MLRILPASLLLPLILFCPASAADKKPHPLEEARSAYESKDYKKAVALLTELVAINPKSVQAYQLRGQALEALRQHPLAFADYSRVLELDPKQTEIYHLRGCLLFKQGKFAESVADFDRYLEKNPKRKAEHWQRGISCYYAGKFEEGRQQFDIYQTFDNNDVENAVWRFMCQAKIDDIAKCRKEMLKIGEDQRIPMKEVYDLFMGKAEPKDVLAAAKEKLPVRPQDNPLFYAHLYLGLYFETMGDKKRALGHLHIATEDYPHGRYMWEVGRVHRDVLRKELEKK